MCLQYDIDGNCEAINTMLHCNEYYDTPFQPEKRMANLNINI